MDLSKALEPKKKLIQISLFIKQNRLTGLETKFMVTRGQGLERGIDWEFGIDMYTLLYLK